MAIMIAEELMSRTYHCDTKEGLFAMVKDHIGFVGPMTVTMSKWLVEGKDGIELGWLIE